ncbi:MAG: adenine phosphoribosyltransferase [Gaiellaceae bacterium]|nr:adenine phosphoribosyltransferase [Gaiellaceae bacterium]
MTVADELLTRFRWVDGHADIWRLFVDGEFFARMIAALADPFRPGAITKVAGIEARGFIVGGAVAGELHAGFVAIRKEGGLFPGEKLRQETLPDYRGNATTLQLQRSSLGPDDRVLLVDDWFETGSQALTAKSLIGAAGAVFVGASVIVDQLDPEIRPLLGQFSALVHSDALGPSV